MAIPTMTDDDVIYIVEISMGSQFQGRSWDLDDFNRQMEYKHGKKIRNEIGAIRQEVNTVINGTCMKFHKKVKFTSASGKAVLEKACEEASRKMKAIDPSLHVTPVFFEQTGKQLSSGNMFELMQKQLNEQINQRVLDRIEDVLKNAEVKDENGKVTGSKNITGKTRTALISMVEKIKAINILGDQNINARIETLKQRLESDTLISIRDEILGYIEDVQNEDNLEITPAKAAPEMQADPELDEDKYKARPMIIPINDTEFHVNHADAEDLV